MSLAAAATADCEQELRRAASLYEASLDEVVQDRSAIVDMAFVYWTLTDPGTAAALNLSSAFVEQAARRKNDLFALGLRLYPASTSLRFWDRYFRWIDVGAPLDAEYCEALLREDPSELAPALYLAMSSGGRRARREAERLLAESRRDNRTRARYVASVLMRVLDAPD